MSSVVIECRESDSINQDNINNNAGDWQTIIKEPYSLMEGSTVQIINSFIDTEASESSKISIDEDIDVNLSFNLYYMRNRLDGQLNQAGNPPVGGDADAETYVACTQQSTGPQAGFYTCDVIQYTPNNFQNPDEYGNVNMTISYTGQSGVETRTFYLNSANIQNQGEDGGWYTSIEPFTFQPPAGVVPTASNSNLLGITVVNPEDLKAKNVYPTFGRRNWNGDTFDGLNCVAGSQTDFKSWAITAPAQTTNSLYQPVVRNYTFQLDKGNYSTDNLVLEMNRQLQKNNGAVGSTFNTPFLISTDGSKPAKLKYFDETAPDTVLYMIRSDGKQLFTFDGTATVDTQPSRSLIGASNIEISFNDAQGRFEFSYLHFPYMANSPSAAADGKFYSGFLNINGLKEVGKNGGIVFSALSATLQGPPDKDGNPTTTTTPYDFWSAKLGFDLDTLIGNSTNTTETIGTEDAQVGMRIPVNGTNTTSGFIGIATGVNLTGQNGPWWNQFPNTTDLMSATTDTVEVLANQNITNIAFSFGYFLIEVKAEWENDFIGSKEKYSFISQIVSRYYSLNSYTNASDGALIYTHKGEPVTLNSFKIRILDSNKQVPKFLGNDSTVFIQILTP